MSLWEWAVTAVKKFSAINSIEQIKIDLEDLHEGQIETHQVIRDLGEKIDKLESSLNEIKAVALRASGAVWTADEDYRDLQKQIHELSIKIAKQENT
jgi:predicted  nucleic acid-binding Zn-ribbon protein